MADYTEQQLKDAARKAYEDGNVDAAKRLIAEARRVGGLQPVAAPAPEGVGAVEDVAKSAGSGLLRGVTSLVDTPAIVSDLLLSGISKGQELITGEPMSQATRDYLRMTTPLATPFATQAAEKVAPAAMAYDPQTTTGEYAQTVGEFLPGAALGGPRAIIPTITAGLGSEAAGQATEGTAFEGPARLAGGIAGGMAGATAMARRPSQIAGAADDIVDHVAVLEKHGITPYKGQVADSDALMRMEGTLTARVGQLDDLTGAALKTAGIDARRATPKVLASGQKAITDTMNDIVANVDVPLNSSLGQRIASVADDFFESSAGRDLPVDLRRVKDELLDAVTDPSGRALSASLLKTWRTRLGSYTTSANELTQDAAHALRSIIDDATHDALTNLGRADDVAALAASRKQYQNFLALVKATNYAGRDAARGIISPERLATATRRVYGDQNYALGRGGDLPELARSSVAVLGAKPAVASGATREIMTPLTLGAMGAAGGAASGGIGPAVVGAGLGLGAPAAGKAIMRSRLAQSIMSDPRNLTKSGSILPGLLAQQE